VAAVEGEENASLVAVMLLPPTAVSDRLVSVLVRAVFEIVIRHGDGESVLALLIR